MLRREPAPRSGALRAGARGGAITGGGVIAGALVGSFQVQCGDHADEAPRPASLLGAGVELTRARASTSVMLSRVGASRGGPLLGFEGRARPLR